MPKICNITGCNNPVFGGGYCKYHQIHRGIKPKKTTNVNRIRKFSKKLSKLNTKYSQLREEFLSEHKICEANLLCCSKIATDIHHKKGRGIYLLDTSTWLAVCRSCHNWIEVHPKEAKERNLSSIRLN